MMRQCRRPPTYPKQIPLSLMAGRPNGPRKRVSARRLPKLQALQPRQMLAADGIPLGATPTDTGEFLLGRVAVTPVFFESSQATTNTQNWTTEEIDETLAKIADGVAWWSDLLDSFDTVHQLEFVIDDTWARQPVVVPYETIELTSNDHNQPASSFLSPLGYGDSASLGDAVVRFNHDQRQKLNTDWAFTIFIADASDDPDGAFASGGSFSTAFAYPGGQYIVTPSTRPASTITHEMGHIFWARDEYSGGGSWTDTRGYYDAQNWNAADNPTPGFVQQVSIMGGRESASLAYNTLTTPASTLAMIGWRDSDGDGVFDVADVPLELDLIGSLDADSGLYRIQGSASAVPLLNANSSGNQSDITLNEISRLEYRLDDGPWITAESPQTQTWDFSLDLDVGTDFQSIGFRVIDDTTGITSPTIEGERNDLAISQSAVRGGVFIDADANGVRDAGESWLALGDVTLRDSNGDPLFSASVSAADLPDHEVRSNHPAGAFSATGDYINDRVAVSDTFWPDATIRRVFQPYNVFQNNWVDRWDDRSGLVARPAQTVGTAMADVIGYSDGSYGRIEAYDVDGNLIARQASPPLGPGESFQLVVDDPQGRIAKIIVGGHAGTSIGIEGLHFGQAFDASLGDDGSFRFDGLADGTYQVAITPDNLTLQTLSESIDVTVIGGVAAQQTIPVQVVDSPRFNADNPVDVNGDHEISALDALLVINDLNRNGNRTLGLDEMSGLDIDVSNDGQVTANDALRVINALARGATSAGTAGDGEGEAAQPAPATSPPAPHAWASVTSSTGSSDSVLGDTAISASAEGEEGLGESSQSRTESTNGALSPLASGRSGADSSDHEDGIDEPRDFFFGQLGQEIHSSDHTDPWNFPGTGESNA